MTTNASTWEPAVRDQVRLIAGAWADETADAWTAFADRPLVHVTVHGGYDAGKTSLIKRFLVEDGTPVPEWLAVGAKPTSFEVRRIESDGIVWVDTPGTDSGNNEHDALSVDALTLADAVLVVLSPQMLSGAQGIVQGLLDGRFYNGVGGAGLFAPGSLLLAVAQMDTAGAAPWDDVAGYHRLVDSKRAELVAALGRGSSGLDGHLHFVAADPEQAGQSADPSPEDYAGNESWDGVAELRADLRTLVERRAQLRVGASVRYWSWVGDHARQRAEAEAERLEHVIDEARRQDEVIKLVLEELDAVDRNARHKLRDAIYDELLTGLAPTDDNGGSRAAIERRLDSVIGSWLLEWGGKLDALARRAATELRVRAQRPGAAALQSYLTDLFANELISQPQQGSSIDQILKRLDGHAKTVARAGYRLLQGMSVDEARAEVTRLRYLNAEQLETYFTGAEGLLSSKEQVEQVRTNLSRLDAVEAMLPIAMELAGFVAGVVSDQRAERRHAALRVELRGQADEIANDIVNGEGGAQTWSNAVAALRTALADTNMSRDVALRSEERRLAVVDAAKRLTDLLAQAHTTMGSSADETGSNRLAG